MRKELKMVEEILRLPRVTATIGMGRSWIYLAVQEGRFPAPIQLGARAIGWKRSDVQAWLDSRQRVL
jgi:prophage regulatory protein